MMDISCDFLFAVGQSENQHSIHPLVFRVEHKASWSDIKDICVPRIEYAAQLPDPHLSIELPKDKTFAIIGTAYTLYDYINDLSLLRADGKAVCSINRAHEFLTQRGIIPDFHIFFERDLETIEHSLGGKPHKDVTYLICSTCNENIFKQLEGYKRIVWHTVIPNPDYHQIITSKFPNEPLIGIGPTSFLKSMGIGEHLGYKKFELYGIDCSFPFDGPDHIDEYPDVDPEDKFFICAKKGNTYRKYYTNTTLALQTIDFMNHVREYNDLFSSQPSLEIKIHGDGMLGFVYGK